MRKVVTPAGKFGPYRRVDILADRFRCDGSDLPFSVVGQGTVEDAVPEDFPPPPPPPPVVPNSVPLLAFVFALDDAGTPESAVDAAIAALPAGAQKRKLKAWWNKSTEIKRRSPQLAALATVMSWTGAQLDQWFITAEGVDL